MLMATREPPKGTQARARGQSGRSERAKRQPEPEQVVEQAPEQVVEQAPEQVVEQQTPVLEGVAPDAPARTLREWRDEAFMSQREFARALGVNPASIALWETGTHRPQQRTVRRLAARLGIRPQQIALPPLPAPTKHDKQRRAEEER